MEVQNKMEYIIRPCEKPNKGSMGLTFDVDLPMRVQKDEVIELILRKEPWDEEWSWLNSKYWRVDHIVHRKKNGGYVMDISVSSPLSKK